MKDSIRDRLEGLTERYDALTGLLSTREIICDQDKFRNFSKESHQLEPVVLAYKQYQAVLHDLEVAKALLEDPDDALQDLAKEEVVHCTDALEKITNELYRLLLPHDPDDERNIYLEIRAGAGGDEATLFAGVLFRMYARYAERHGWRVEVISAHASEQGGFKEVISKIDGIDVFARLKFESGTHRVQRVPATEAQGRIHTSTCTVAVMPEVAAIAAITINPSDLKVDTYRASGAGGQHVNKTDSAIRITHLPSGIVVECQDERSQHKNRSKAMSLLQSRLMAASVMKQQNEQAATRKKLVGTGDRSERIRTYNYPQGRLTEHRIQLTSYQLEDILEGALDQVIEPLLREAEAESLSELGTREE